MRWIEALKRLALTPKQCKRLMQDVASNVGDRQKVEKVLIQGWSKQGGAGEHK